MTTSLYRNEHAFDDVAPVSTRACPICRSPSSRTFLSASARNNRHKVELRKCGCGFVYSAVSRCTYTGDAGGLARQPRDRLLGVAKAQGLDKLTAEIVSATGLRRARVLDFGCGVGLAAMCFQARGLDVFGVESCRGHLRKHEELRIRSAPALDGIGAARFDLIVLKDVLEHVPDPVGLLRQLSGRLALGGFLYVRVPNVNTYWLHRSVDTESHVNHFSPASLHALIAANGLRREKFIGVHDISSRAGRLYHALVWPLRNVAYHCHQISALYRLDPLNESRSGSPTA